MEAPVVTLLSDYGLRDAFVGVCHGVIARGCPAARVIDVTHGIAPHDVRGGAITLAHALAFLPVGVHVAGVDAGDGPRRELALQCADGRRLVGPDNGLLWPAAQAAGGVRAAVDIGDSPWALRPVSATFPGRDVYCAVAAALAGGVSLAAAGAPVDPATLVALTLPEPRHEDGALVAHVLGVDRFGNLELDARAGDLAPLGLAAGDRVAVAHAGGRSLPVAYGRRFGDVADGELVLYEDPQARLALAVNRGSAAVRLAAGADAELRISAA